MNTSNKLRQLIPEISLKTSYRNPIKSLGISGRKTNTGLRSTYKKYTNIKSYDKTDNSKNMSSKSQRTNLIKGSASYVPGNRITNTANYNNDAAKGQCVWYVRGRASEKLGVDPGAIGNANQMYYNAKDSAKVTATKDNIRPNMIVSYGTGTSSEGQNYGHVIFIEDVVGDTVYYTEGGSGYYKNGTDGVVKTASRQGIIDGVNSSGTRMGSNVIGFIDLSKY